ncbi:hypothetical protein [Ornithinimicrobium tianjinense]|nr:hypothetical protein [Ornithinimicrobium tianjinense]
MTMTPSRPEDVPELRLGVGPGALMASQAGPRRLAETIGAALAWPSRPTGRPTCPVLGAGPVARHLSLLLGGVAATEQSAGPAVQVHHHVIPPDVALTTSRAGLLRLPVVVQPRRIVVGPLSGLPEGPCLHCLDLRRRDRDPAWPEVATALGHPARQLEPVPVVPEVLATAEGVVMLLIASVVAHRPVAAGLAHEIGPHAPHVVTRTWTRHPECPWHPGWR